MLLDIEMWNMSGVELAKEIKFINPHTNIIFATGYTEYMNEAFEMHVSTAGGSCPMGELK